MLEFTRLTTPDDGVYPAALALYRQSFPAHEQRTSAAQQAALSHPDYRFTCLMADGRFAGLLLYWEAADFIYVEHFCIETHLRGQRYGERALALLAAVGKPVILEIDPPADDISVRRLGFYRRAGYRDNPFVHVHPPYHPENKGHALMVLSYPHALTPEAYAAFAAYLGREVMGGL